ncbi:MAG: hypothetical protein U9N73_07480 [Candidatus Auribacterota bacterium]|nr:hypothetical protein [Candidatus Auribacterota bacterium]
MDKFDKIMDRFLLPMTDFTGPVMDSTYFLRQDGSFVFSEGYCHPRDAFWGMIIKYPLPGGHIDIFGREYSWTHREYVDGELRMVPNHLQVENQFKVAPELRAIQGDKPPYADNFVKFPLSDYTGYFDARHSMLELREEHKWIDKAVKETCELLGWNPEATGVTGSLAYGRVEDDVDMMFIGSPEENAAIAQKIKQFTAANPEARVFELGKEWPLRFYYAGTLICPFFRYASSEQIPLIDCDMEVIEKEITLEATVVDDTHNLYLPALVGLTDIKREDGQVEDDLDLIIYHGALRGEIWEGDRIRIKPSMVNVIDSDGNRGRAALITDDIISTL